MSYPFRTVTTIFILFGLCACSTPQNATQATLSKTIVKGRSSGSLDFGFPEGVNWSNATPDQIIEAVFNAVKNNPDAAPDIATAALENAATTGRWQIQQGSDGKMTADPEPNFWRSLARVIRIAR
jgi:hypothetical protein